MYSSCCDKDSAIIFTTGRLPDVKQEWVLTTANAIGTNGLTCLSNHRELETINFGHPPDD
jgi:hypothetical protein